MAKPSEAVYPPLIQALADHKPHTVQSLMKVLPAQGNALLMVVQALLVLTGQGHVHPVQAEPLMSKAATTAKKLNQHLMQLAQGSAEVSFLASPVTGGGITVGRIQQLFLLSIGQGKKQPQEWVQETWALFKGQGQRLVKAGQTLQTDEENVAELTQLANDFQTKALPVLRGFGVV